MKRKENTGAERKGQMAGSRKLGARSAAGRVSLIPISDYETADRNPQHPKVTAIITRHPAACHFERGTNEKSVIVWTLGNRFISAFGMTTTCNPELETCNSPGVEPACSADSNSDPRLRNCGSESAAPIERNSTVFHKPQSQKGSIPPAGDVKNPEGKSVIIDFSHEDLAIRACDLLRFFNN